MVRIKPLDTLAQRRRSGDRLTCLLRPYHGTDSAPIPNRSMTPDPGAATPTQLRISLKPDPNDRRWPIAYMVKADRWEAFTRFLDDGRSA